MDQLFALPLRQEDPTPTTPPRHILLVDDSRTVREVVALMLDTLGHAVTPADSGEAAVALLADGLAVDLVLTDYHMPGMNGVELAQQIRRRRPELRIGLVTGTLDVAEDMPTVFDFVLAKPVTVGALRQALGSPPVAPDPP